MGHITHNLMYYVSMEGHHDYDMVNKTLRDFLIQSGSPHKYVD